MNDKVLSHGRWRAARSAQALGGTLTTRRFFRPSLFLPVIAGVSAGLLSPGSFLAVALIYGGLPYVLLAVIAYFAIGRARNLARLAAISIAIPLAMLLLLAPFDFMLGTVGLLVVSAYAAIAWLLYAVLRTGGLVHAMPPNKSLERSRER